jgi:hypothetical protein
MDCSAGPGWFSLTPLTVLPYLATNALATAGRVTRPARPWPVRYSFVSTLILCVVSVGSLSPTAISRTPLS